jgi:lysophospholipase L1-like esterase
MNDCSAGRNIGLDEFRGNLLALADRLAALGALAVLQTTCPILPGTSPDREPNYPQYMDAIRSVAAARHLPLIDHQRYWSQNAGKLYYWMSDAFHPNELGHRAFALLLYRELGIEDPASACCRLFIP